MLTFAIFPFLLFLLGAVLVCGLPTVVCIRERQMKRRALSEDARTEVAQIEAAEELCREVAMMS